KISVEAFNYSSYALGRLSSRDVYNHWNMVRDPTMREYLMTVSVKPPAAASADAPLSDWRSLIEDPEQSWQRALPAVMAGQPADLPVEHELQLVKLQRNYDDVQHQVNVRDEMIKDLHERLVREVQRRDEIIDGLHLEQDWMRSGWRRFVIRPPKS